VIHFLEVLRLALVRVVAVLGGLRRCGLIEEVDVEEVVLLVGDIEEV